ncbi:16S rRNA (guanine(966)-N(2))-methyltransferase RsmD [Fluviispira multicolorata]|uniref:16S rRNA (Guanine(966)-N(2))-methyltransferase RsmD n=1 Tax=Fluviispira multicolorata TaxID=2654512 RepID=A0A833JBE5_9BACT|nr:16S rRNA (guanine(966)-N(2))-methyltransferase RsmD [Fluviispira multicolorata]KAB8029114.1 16S rRNA (guanine(966)-N(2))-methyltransferase RsmD [Fluviispira multicolorata]
MRVIAGKYKRRNLVTTEGNEITRPTSDRVKESVFNILSDELLNAKVLDLFSGSGSLGIESLSRGANFVTFVEKNIEPANCIQVNLNGLKVPENEYSIIKLDVTKFLTSYSSQEKYDIIFADPPYKSPWYANSLDEIENANVCNKNCTVIFEMPKDLKISIQSKFKGWSKDDERIYGKTKIEIWRKREEA